MTSIDQFNDRQFTSDECGDSLWNEENLNPGKVPGAGDMTFKGDQQPVEIALIQFLTNNRPFTMQTKHQFIKINGVDIFYREAGPGRTRFSVAARLSNIITYVQKPDP